MMQAWKSASEPLFQWSVEESELILQQQPIYSLVLFDSIGNIGPIPSVANSEIFKT